MKIWISIRGENPPEECYLCKNVNDAIDVIYNEYVDDENSFKNLEYSNSHYRVFNNLNKPSNNLNKSSRKNKTGDDLNNKIVKRKYPFKKKKKKKKCAKKKNRLCNSNNNKRHLKKPNDSTTQVCKICGGTLKIPTEEAAKSTVNTIYTIFSFMRNRLNIDEETDHQITKTLHLIEGSCDLLKLIDTSNINE